VRRKVVGEGGRDAGGVDRRGVTREEVAREGVGGEAVGQEVAEADSGSLDENLCRLAAALVRDLCGLPDGISTTGGPTGILMAGGPGGISMAGGPGGIPMAGGPGGIRAPPAGIDTTRGPRPAAAVHNNGGGGALPAGDTGGGGAPSVGSTGGGGALLVFLPGWQEIRAVRSLLLGPQNRPPNQYSPSVFPSLCSADGRAISVHTLHSAVPLWAQREALAPSPPGTLKIVLATSIAEASLTIPDALVVIDTGVL